MFNSNCANVPLVATLNDGNSNGMGWGGDWAWWIVILLIFGWGNNGFGGGFGGGNGVAENYVLASDFATIQRQLSDGFNSIDNALDAQNSGICNLGYTQLELANGVNMNIMQGNNALQAQIAQCCCDVREGISGVNYNLATQACNIGRQIERGFADTNYNLATQNCATLQAIDKVGDRIIDYMSQEKMQTLRDENQALRLAASQQAQNNYLVNELRPCPIPAYITCNPFAQTNYVNGCGCN